MAQILVIEDETEILRMIISIVENAGHQTISASNGSEGLDAYRQHQIDLVITDIMMPQKDGVETIRELRRNNPEAKIIAITGFRGQYNRLPAAQYVGAQRTLIKPFSQIDLV
ncbi:MAG: response regulator, partial [Candidatus Latescibacteria bacterium]|nr:response regulator [Candidatus Latescibacterota bacterium]